LAAPAAGNLIKRTVRPVLPLYTEIKKPFIFMPFAIPSIFGYFSLTFLIIAQMFTF